ncbi:MAG TPA: N-acetyltransferase, partial [Anaerolineae bacterium]|nr:N-acetyltransferase [Anaerolineae bacterium]
RPESNATRVLRRLFPIPNHLYSHTYAFVADADGEVVGLFLGFDKKEWEAAQRAMGREIGFGWFKVVRPWHLVRMILAIIDLARTFEPLSDENYTIQMLAVLPEVRRRGIATQLMGFAAEQARSKGLKRLVLDVLIENEGARRFYEHMGFRAVKTVTDPRFCRRFGVQGSIRMVKPIDAHANADR